MVILRKYDPEIHHRRSIRLKGYDYGQAGMYFITLCTHGRDCLFGHIEDGIMVLNQFGKIACDEWVKTPGIRTNTMLGDYIVMPNHFHGIILITGVVGAYCNTPLPPADGDMVPTNGVYGYTPQPADGDMIPTNGAYGNTPHWNSPVPPAVGAYSHTPQPTPQPTLRSPSKTVGAIVRGYKSAVTKQINILRGKPKCPVWQRNYYEHIIRNDREYNRISKYIINNPQNWDNDKFLQ